MKVREYKIEMFSGKLVVDRYKIGQNWVYSIVPDDLGLRSGDICSGWATDQCFIIMVKGKRYSLQYEVKLIAKS